MGTPFEEAAWMLMGARTADRFLEWCDDQGHAHPPAQAMAGWFTSVIAAAITHDRTDREPTTEPGGEPSDE